LEVVATLALIGGAALLWSTLTDDKSSETSDGQLDEIKKKPPVNFKTTRTRPEYSRTHKTYQRRKLARPNEVNEIYGFDSKNNRVPCIDIPPQKPEIESLQGKIKIAIKNRETIAFNYTKANGSSSTRSLVPQILEMVGYGLCVRGICNLRNEPRNFALRRMSNLTIKKNVPF
jgi:hypothetical protein